MTDRLRRSSSLCLLIAGGLLTILSARPAEAAPVGPSVNGLSVNGLSVNGLSVNGLGVNGVKQNGIKQNGTAPLVDRLTSRRFSSPDNVSTGDLRIPAIVLRDGHRLEGR